MKDILDIENVEDVKLEMVGLKKDIKSLEHRMTCQEKFNDEMRRLTTSVELIAQSISEMVKKQNKQEDDIEELDVRVKDIELKPAKEWSSFKKYTTIALVSSTISFIVGAVFTHFTI